MIKIIISGPQGVGKSRLADDIYRMVAAFGLKVSIWTTNENVQIPAGAEKE